MIKLLGLGLSLDFLPLGALLRLFTCEKVLLDTYTSSWYPSIRLIAEVLKQKGIEVVEAGRRDLEGESIGYIIEEARHREICIAVVGDPMIATTHSAIVVEAFKNGLDVEVFPATSILNVGISLSCLQVYRFGKIVTIVKPKNGIVYDYPLQVIKSNRERNLHTLTLLEIDLEKNVYMTPREALEILFYVQKMYGYNVLSEEDEIIVLRDIGSDRGSISVEKARDILNNQYTPSLYTMIIPAKPLHPIERECIQNINKIIIKPQVTVELFKAIINEITTFSMKQKLYNI